MTETEVHRLAVKLGRSSYRGVDYHILSRYLSFHFRLFILFLRNCNHFSDTLTRHLCGAKIPKWINRLAYLGTFVPPRFIPSVRNVPVANSPEQQQQQQARRR
jgi:hypothetical protein